MAKKLVVARVDRRDGVSSNDPSIVELKLPITDSMTDAQFLVEDPGEYNLIVGDRGYAHIGTPTVPAMIGFAVQPDTSDTAKPSKMKFIKMSWL